MTVLARKFHRKPPEPESGALRISFKRSSHGDRIFLVINFIIISLFLLIEFYPLWYCIIASFSDANALTEGRVWVWPVGFNLKAYSTALNNPRLVRGFFNSIIYTVGKTMLALSITFPFAYAISRNDLPGLKFFLIFILIPNYFGGGLIPNFLLVRDLGMLNSPWSMVLPFAANSYNVIVCRSYFKQNIPSELLDCSRIDGCGDVRFFFKIAIPLATPIIAVMTLNYAVEKWNSYQSALIYLNDKQWYPFQMVLREVMFINGLSLEQKEAMDPNSLAKMEELMKLLRYSTMIIGVLPMMIAYPFVQKYFIKGMLVGSVKG